MRIHVKIMSCKNCTLRPLQRVHTGTGGAQFFYGLLRHPFQPSLPFYPTTSDRALRDVETGIYILLSSSTPCREDTVFFFSHQAGAGQNSLRDWGLDRRYLRFESETLTSELFRAHTLQ